MDVSPLTTAVAWLGAGLLVLAGAGKMPVPDSAMSTLHSLHLPSGRIAGRVVGLGEIAAGVGVIVVGGRVGAGVLAAVYAALLAVAARQRAKQLDCGCFGITAPVTPLHLGLNATMLMAGLVGLAAPPWSLGAVAADAGLLAVSAAVLMLATGVGLLRTLLTEAARRSTLKRVNDAREQRSTGVPVA